MGGKLSEEEMRKRRRAHEAALANNRLEGLEPTPEMLERAERWIRGEITIEESIAEVLEKAKREVASRKEKDVL